MSNRIKRSAVLLKASWEVLKSHRSLLLLPIISSIVTLVVIASFTVPVVTALSLDPELRNEVSAEMTADLASENQSSTASTPATTADPAKTASATRTPKDPDAAKGGGLSDFWKATGILYLLFFYISTSFVVIFFNAALIAAADEHFQGRPTGLRIGLGLALRRVPLILAWSIVAGTIGMILRLLSERAGLIGKIVLALVGMAWSIASYFALPAVVLEGVGPIKAIRSSVQTLRSTWGETLMLAVGFGVIGIVISVLAFGLMIGGVVVFAFGLSVGSGVGISIDALGGILFLAGIVILILWSIVSGTLRGITQVALYRFATADLVPDGFEREDLEAAFQKKSKKSRSFGLG